MWRIYPYSVSFVKVLASTLWLFLNACGFQPLYTLEQGELSRIEIGLIPDRLGQKLRNLLYERFYQFRPLHHALYRLDIEEISQEEKDLIQEEGIVIRRALIVRTQYSLWDLGANHSVFSDTSIISVAYNVVRDSPFGTFVAKQNASDRALLQILQHITQRITAFLVTAPASQTLRGSNLQSDENYSS